MYLRIIIEVIFWCDCQYVGCLPLAQGGYRCHSLSFPYSEGGLLEEVTWMEIFLKFCSVVLFISCDLSLVLLIFLLTSVLWCRHRYQS